MERSGQKLVTVHKHEVVVWSNGNGVQWDITSLPDGNFTRIQWSRTANLEKSLGRAGRFVVVELSDTRWHSDREPTFSEIYNFALLAKEQCPDSEAASKMVLDAAEVLRNEAEKQMNRVKELLNS